MTVVLLRLVVHIDIQLTSIQQRDEAIELVLELANTPEQVPASFSCDLRCKRLSTLTHVDGPLRLRFFTCGNTQLDFVLAHLKLSQHLNHELVSVE